MSKEIKNENAEAVAEAVSKTELFLNKNKNVILSVLGAVVLIGAGYFCYHKFIYQPKVAEAQEQTFPAEENFRNAEYDLALNGDGNVLGFSQIIKEYGAKAGTAVYFYAGVCELQLGNYESAISYLKSYKGKDEILAARAFACIGDAYVGLEDYNSALTWFEKAAAKADNAFAAGYLLKAGVVCEELGKADKALVLYKKIKESYPQSMEGYEIDKYISRIENK